MLSSMELLWRQLPCLPLCRMCADPMASQCWQPAPWPISDETGLLSGMDLAERQACVLQVAVVILAAAGRFTLLGAVLVDVGTALAVILNGMRCLRWSVETGSVWGPVKWPAPRIAELQTCPENRACRTRCSTSCDKKQAVQREAGSAQELLPICPRATAGDPGPCGRSCATAGKPKPCGSSCATAGDPRPCGSSCATACGSPPLTQSQADPELGPMASGYLSKGSCAKVCCQNGAVQSWPACE